MVNSSDMNCLFCDSGNVSVEFERRDQAYGLPSINLVNVPAHVCGDCGERYVRLPKSHVLMRQIAEVLSDLNHDLAPSEFAFMRHHLRLSAKELAKRLGVSDVTVSRWEQGHSGIPRSAIRFVQTMVLASLGRERQLNKMFSEIGEDNQAPIDIDLSRFDGASYSYETCLTFGGHRSQEPAKIHITVGN